MPAAGNAHHTDRVAEAEGFFGPASLSWHLLQERATLLGGGRAILLQLAHPLVAAGVAQHSTVAQDPLGRLDRTLAMMLTIVFGARADAEQTLRQFHALHARVTGEVPLGCAPFPAGSTYTAQDPALKLWVHATLFDSALLVYERFVGPLAAAERRAGYNESKRLAALLGIPRALLPATLADFDRYMAAMVASPTLTVTDTARSLADAVLDPPLGLLPRTGLRVVGFVTAGLLPERLRQAYGLRWSPRHQVMLELLGRAIRRLLPLTPGPLRLLPQARAARRRVAHQQRPRS